MNCPYCGKPTFELDGWDESHMVCLNHTPPFHKQSQGYSDRKYFKELDDSEKAIINTVIDSSIEKLEGLIGYYVDIKKIVKP